jgi:hypothetical protein
MTTLTISKSGTAWIQDMKAQGKSAGAGWASSPNAAYYASLDTDHPMAKPSSGLPTSFAELLKSHATDTDDWNSRATAPIASANANRPISQPASAGQLINVKA